MVVPAGLSRINIRPMIGIEAKTLPVLDFWFDFASTYSYPAAMRLRLLAREAGVEVRFRPFLLGPIFKSLGWDTSPFNLYPAKGGYMWRDVARICAALGLAFQRPEPFPQNGLLAARVALVGLREGWGEDFCVSVFRAQFGEGRQIGDPETLGAILAACRYTIRAKCPEMRNGTAV